jgi:proteic killer suppression protein
MKRKRSSSKSAAASSGTSKRSLRKLIQLNRAKTLEDLRSPGNLLKALSRDRAGQHSIRINSQYRLCFTWEDGDARGVEIVDYR